MKMKRLLFISLLFITILFSSCRSDGKVKINYTTIYPDTTITTETIVSYKYVTEDPNSVWLRRKPYLNSNRGSNYIVVGNVRLGSTTCPIRLNSYEYIE